MTKYIMKTIILFDVDGTLTDPMKTIRNNMIEKVNELSTSDTDIAIVGGSNIDKQIKQLGENVLKKFKYIFSENGLVSYEVKDNELDKFHSKNIFEFIGEKNYKNLVNICMSSLIELDPPIKRGTFIEARTGMINVSPIGRSCSQSEREEFNKSDFIFKYRENLINSISNKWNSYRYENNIIDLELCFSIGGQISVDIFPKNWDKTYCLQFLKSYDRILFFGDKTYEGGNDYEIFIHPLTESYSVLSPEDTIEKLEKLNL